MATTRQIARWALALSPLVVLPLGFFALIPWLEDQNEAIEMAVAAAFALLLMGYSVFLASRVNRRLDEVQIAGQRIAQTKGMTLGVFAAVLLLTFPPSMDALVSLAEAIASGRPEKAIKIAAVLGFMLVVVLQTLAMFAVSIWWERRVYRHE